MSHETPSQRTFTAEVGLRWSDMDAYGHVNNVQYHRLLEEARIVAFANWFDSSGGEDMLSSGLLLARQEIEFLDQLVHRPEPVLVDMWITQIGGASWDMASEVRDAKELGGRVYARAESTLVAFDRSAQRPRALSDEERTALRAYLGEPARMRRRR